MDTQCVNWTPETVYKVIVTVLLVVSECLALFKGSSPNGIIHGLIIGLGSLLAPSLKDEMQPVLAAVQANTPSVGAVTPPALVDRPFVLQPVPVRASMDKPSASPAAGGSSGFVLPTPVATPSNTANFFEGRSIRK